MREWGRWELGKWAGGWLGQQVPPSHLVRTGIGAEEDAVTRLLRETGESEFTSSLGANGYGVWRFVLEI